MTAKEVEDKLARRYSPPFFAFFPQFRDATGWEASRTADAVAFGLYATRGYAFHGFEIKVNRSDWLAELKDAKKADAVGVYCDRWWVVAPKGVILPGEVPDAWGWLEATGRGLRGLKEAPERKAAPMERHLVASLIQRALGGRVEGEIVTGEEASKKAAKEYERGVKKGIEQARWEREGYERLERKVQEFEKASGIDISRHYMGEHLGNQIALLEELGHGGMLEEASRLANSLRSWADDIQGKAKEMTEQTRKVRGEGKSA